MVIRVPVPTRGEFKTLDLRGRSLTKEIDLTPKEFLGLVELAGRLRDQKRAGNEIPRLVGRNLALVFEKSSTRTRSAFEVAAHDQGAHTTYFGPEGSHIGHKESMRDTARVLGRLFDGIEFRGFDQHSVEILAEVSGVPVWNGLTDSWHPTQMLADFLTMIEARGGPVEQISVCYLGDGRNNTASSLLVTGALLGADVRIASPHDLSPTPEVRAIADGLARSSGARLLVSADVDTAVAGVDFVYTDVWLSMGEPVEHWGERIKALLPYQVNTDVLEATKNPDVRFLHCLPAMHNRETEVGEQIYATWQLDALEVTEAVFESDASIVFDQAENRLHTAKALMVATLGD